MNQTTTNRRSVLTFKRFSYKPYSVFCSLKREIHIGCLSVVTLTAAHNGVLASRSDSLQILQQKQPEGELSEIVVSGRIPVTLEQSANKVEIISRDEIEKARVQTINDLLKLCASVDVRQRGAWGVQTDIGIGGGTNEQVSILINGICVNNPQTGHLTADFPVAIRDIERIEVYDGASARCFGSQALNGAINIITRCEKKDNAGISCELGSYGTAGIGGFGNLSTSGYSQRLSAEYMRSDGATTNSDFQRVKAFYQGNYKVDNASLKWQAGYNYQRYGANTFYSANYPNQWERNNRVLLSLGGHSQLGKLKLEPVLSMIRSYDHFQLIRGTHTTENFHRNDVFTSAVNAYTHWALGRTAFGGELRHEGILSSNLGKPLDESRYVKVEGHPDISYTRRDIRNNASFFLEHLAYIHDFTMSAGVMANRNSSVDDRFRFYPGVDISWRGIKRVKLYVSYNRSLRLPSFTDLYYKSPTQEGNVGLKPEEMSTSKIGADYAYKALSFSLQGIYRHGTDMIDWVMYHANDIYHSTQFKLDNYELLAHVNIDFTRTRYIDPFLQSLKISYMFNHQKRFNSTEVFKSNYALEYLRNKLTLNLNHRIYGPLNASWYWIWQDRMGGYLMTENHSGTVQLKTYSPYSLVNLKISYSQPRYSAFISMENMTNHTYYDFGSIPQPGFTFLVGFDVSLK